MPVGNGTVNPNGAFGRIVLAVPALLGNPVQDALYEGWLYAAVSTPGGVFQGLYLTKDYGNNWTKVRLPVFQTINNGKVTNQIPTNNDSITTDFSVDGSADFPQANYNVTLAVDPNNPNILYFGGTADPPPGIGFIRIDVTTVSDPYAIDAFDNSNNDGGLTQGATTGDVSLKKTTDPYGLVTASPESPYLDLLRDPANPVLDADHAPARQHFPDSTTAARTPTGLRSPAAAWAAPISITRLPCAIP